MKISVCASTQEGRKASQAGFGVGDHEVGRVGLLLTCAHGCGWPVAAVLLDCGAQQPRNRAECGCAAQKLMARRAICGQFGLRFRWQRSECSGGCSRARSQPLALAEEQRPLPAETELRAQRQCAEQQAGSVRLPVQRAPRCELAMRQLRLLLGAHCLLDRLLQGDGKRGAERSRLLVAQHTLHGSAQRSRRRHARRPAPCLLLRCARELLLEGDEALFLDAQRLLEVVIRLGSGICRLLRARSGCKEGRDAREAVSGRRRTG